MLFGLLLNFSIFPEKLLTSMVYMVIGVIACSRTYGVSVKVDGVAGVPNLLTPKWILIYC
jgi:hypothetical protein